MVPATVNESDNTADIVSRPWRQFVRLVLWFTVAMLAVSPVFAGVGYWRYEVAGVVAALVAGLVCWLGGVAALALAALVRDPQAAVGSLLGGMFLRAGVPFVFGLVAQQRVSILAAGGIFGMVLAYYLVALLAETLLSLKLVQPRTAGPVMKAKAL